MNEGALDRAVLQWEAFFQTDFETKQADMASVSNYLYCLGELGRHEELTTAAEKFYRSITWFDLLPQPSLEREFSSDSVSIAQLGASLQTFGCALVRGDVDIDRLRAISTKSRVEAWTRTEKIYDLLPEEEVDALTTPTMRGIASAGGFSPKPDQLNSWFRYVNPKLNGTRVPFHQDIKAFGRKCINMWVPLSPAGLEAPGLELLPTLVRGLLAARGGTLDALAQRSLEIADADLEEAYPGIKLWHPVMELGDVLMFVGTTVHRSYVTAEMTKARRSLELRFT